MCGDEGWSKKEQSKENSVARWEMEFSGQEIPEQRTRGPAGGGIVD